MSCNIWYALAGLDTGGANLDAFARRLGFRAALPFDLPTATSQLTNGGGPLPVGSRTTWSWPTRRTGKARC